MSATGAKREVSRRRVKTWAANAAHSQHDKEEDDKDDDGDDDDDEEDELDFIPSTIMLTKRHKDSI